MDVFKSCMTLRELKPKNSTLRKKESLKLLSKKLSITIKHE